MKKLALALVAALPLAFASCGDDDASDLTLDQSSVTLDYNAETTLKASEKNCTWTSSNPFVATVDNDGVVKAAHVGTAVISATKDGNTVKCNVTVNATNNNFTLPEMNWGAKIDAIRPLYTAFDELKDGNYYMFATKNASGLPMYTYEFDTTTGGLVLSQLTVAAAEEEDFFYFIEQRYQYYDTTEDNDDIYLNANTMSEATLYIKYGTDKDDDAYAVFQPMDATRADVHSYDAKAKAAVKATSSVKKH